MYVFRFDAIEYFVVCFMYVHKYYICMYFTYRDTEMLFRYRSVIPLKMQILFVHKLHKFMIVENIIIIWIII